MMLPNVSVIIPTYNRKHLILDALAQLKLQTLKEIEFIIIDDGSDDNSYDLLLQETKQDKRFIILRQEHKGPSVARNKGLSQANGKYIGFFDIDDRIPENYFAELYNVAIAQNADIVYTSYNSIPHRYKSADTRADRIKSLRNGAIWDKLYKKELITQNHIQFAEGLYTADNLWCIQTFSYAENVALINSPSYQYKLQSDSIGKDKTKINKRKNDIFIVIAQIKSFCASVKYTSEEINVLTHFLKRSYDCYPSDKKYSKKLYDVLGIEYTKINERKNWNMKMFLFKLARLTHIINKDEYREKKYIELLEKSPLFDEKWYLSQCPDVKKNKICAIKHYLRYGWKEGYNPSLLFDGNTYLEENPDVASFNICPLVHYLTNGGKDCREYTSVIFGNAEENFDRTAEILIQNKIDYIPKVSIIIPVYNAEKYLRQCLDSVINQTLKEIEIICVDDKSTDTTLEILKEYARKDKRITLIAHKYNQRQSIARGNAMKVARGEYIQYVDSDDWIREDACELLYNYAKENSLDMLQMKAINYNQDKEIFEDRGWYAFRWLPENFKTIFTYKDCKKFITKISVAAWLSFFRHDFLKENNICWLPRKMVFEDNMFITPALLKAERISLLKECLYFRRWHNESTMNSLNSNFGDWPVIVEMTLNTVDKIDSSLVKQYINRYMKSTNSWFANNLSFMCQCRYLKAVLDLYETCINRYHVKLPDENKNTLLKFLWISPIRILRIWFKNRDSLKIALPIFSLQKDRITGVYKIKCKIFGIPIISWKKYKTPVIQKVKYKVLGIPALKIEKKGLYKRVYLFSFLSIWKQSMFKKIETSGQERLILCIDCLIDKDAEAIDAWTFFNWLQEKKIPSRYIVLKDNSLVNKLKEQNHSFKDIIVLNDLSNLLTTCHNDICQSRFIITSFGCEYFNKTLKKIPYLKYIYIRHGVPLLKETVVLNLYSPDEFDSILVPTRATANMYIQKKLMLDNHIMSGLPRWDRLKRIPHQRKNIFIFFTWRRDIRKNALILQNYKQHILNFLTNPKLAKLLSQNQIDLNIAVHHALIRNGGDITVPEDVHLIPPTEISKVIGKTDLFITDYSSLIFDFMYLNIPILFYRFDADFPFLSPRDIVDTASAKSHDHELYNVFYNEEDTIKKIEYYIKHNFELETENISKNKNIFWDIKDNCANLYNQIVEKYK